MQPYSEIDEHQVGIEIREAIPDIADLLQEMIAKGASDLHLTTESPPMIRVAGQLVRLPYTDLDAAIDISNRWLQTGATTSLTDSLVDSIEAITASVLAMR